VQDKKGILQFVKQDYYDYSSTSMIEFLKPSLKWILQFVKQDYYDYSVNLYDCVFETLFKRDFAICQTGLL